MSFTANLPQTGQSLGVTRQPILNNFASLRNTISAGSGNPGAGDKPNHIDVNNTGPGKHIFVEMPVQLPTVNNLPLANEGGMITQTISGKSELFYVRDAINTYYQMTGPSTVATNGCAPLFGGLMIQWGQENIPANGQNVPVTFPTAYSVPAYSVVVTALQNPISGATAKVPGASGISTTGFLITNWNGNFPAAGCLVSWIAIGKQ